MQFQVILYIPTKIIKKKKSNIKSVILFINMVV